jgi:hypothetical protein
MAKNIGKCVHCLKDNVELTDDHMFPKSWYPDTTAENLEKWTIPSCLECNQRLGKLERDLIGRVGAGTKPIRRTPGNPTAETDSVAGHIGFELRCAERKFFSLINVETGGQPVFVKIEDFEAWAERNGLFCASHCRHAGRMKSRRSRSFRDAVR